MLRLRPSELTLTSDDVEETFRRIALRQATRPQSSLPRRPLGQPGRPILRHGPQRATRDALTALGKIPLLQPQQALVTSVNEDGGNTSACEDISSSIDPDSSNNHHADPTTLDHERQDEPVPFPASSASHTVQLPIRARRESAAQSPANDTPSNVPPHLDYEVVGRVNVQAILANHQIILPKHFFYEDISDQPQQAMCIISTNPGKASPGSVVAVKCPLSEADLQVILTTHSACSNQL
ncbi:hypothetical protein P3342_000258 [Pyrenophora teres f. teres]|nr:hypothetical protein P3342_000258 [Pyrenophora teres f. teres]